jgi:hypothetical protein
MLSRSRSNACSCLSVRYSFSEHSQLVSSDSGVQLMAQVDSSQADKTEGLWRALTRHRLHSG